MVKPDNPANTDWTIGKDWVPDPSRSFGQRLALVRQHMAWNVTTAAEESGVDAESWRHWEQYGRTPQRYDQVCRDIADASGCSLVWLMSGYNPHTTQNSIG